MNNSKVLNEKLGNLINEMKNNLVEILKKQEHKTICLCDKDKDMVYGYLFDCMININEVIHEYIDN